MIDTSEKFDDTKGVIRSRTSNMKIQYKDKGQKDKKTNLQISEKYRLRNTNSTKNLW
jgi:hypothetical protein